MSQHDAHYIYQPSGKFQVQFIKSNAYLLSRQVDGSCRKIVTWSIEWTLYPAFIFKAMGLQYRLKKPTAR